MMSVMNAALRLPTELDLHVIHESLLAAGFTRDTRLGDDTPNWVYVKPGNDFEFLSLPHPERGFFDNPDTFDTIATQQAVAVRTLDVLIQFTGDPHLHCGPRNDRERAFAEAFNAAAVSDAHA